MLTINSTVPSALPLRRLMMLTSLRVRRLREHPRARRFHEIGDLRKGQSVLQ